MFAQIVHYRQTFNWEVNELFLSNNFSFKALILILQNITWKVVCLRIIGNHKQTSSPQKSHLLSTSWTILIEKCAQNHCSNRKLSNNSFPEKKHMKFPP